MAAADVEMLPVRQNLDGFVSDLLTSNNPVVLLEATIAMRRLVSDGQCLIFIYFP
jgi:hypothetical protein